MQRRILHVLGGLSLGGAESRIMDLYRNIDRKEIQFDFLVHSKQEEHFDSEIRKMGGNIYRVPRFRIYNYFEYRKALVTFFQTHREFSAVHGHMTSTASIYLPIAKKFGVPVTIAHARSAGVPSGMKGVITRLLRIPLKHRADYCLTCSKMAGVSVFGKEWVQLGKVEVIPNAIDAEKYDYSPSTREEYRKKLNLDEKWVIGHVGSFREAKNHEFLIRIFAEIRKKRTDAVLLLLGEGELMDKIKRLTEELHLSDSVFFLGNHDNVNAYYQAMDYLIFPSFYEGLPGTVVEAQVSGLPCLISNTIADEVKVTDLVTAYSLQKTAGEWAQYVLKHSVYERRSRLEEVKRAGFEIHAQIERYKQIYGGC